MTSYMDFTHESKPIQTVMNSIDNKNRRGIDLQPKYQRGYIWQNEFKDKLIYSIVRRYPIGNISLRVLTEPNQKGSMSEVVDGQQRLTTIYNFIKGSYSLQGEYARKTIEYIISYLGDDDDPNLEKIKKRINSKGKISLKFLQLPSQIQRDIHSYNLAITNITNTTEAEVTEYFRYLQNQEILRAGEIINSIPETKLEKYICEINDKELFLSKIGFPNTRRQFDKLFYGILGLLENAVQFGSLDKNILNYVSNCEDLSVETQKKCKLITRQINYMTNILPYGYIKSNARLMKFLLLLISLSLVDFSEETENKIATLSAINIKLSAFSSAKADSIASAFSGYNNDVIEEYRLIALISKGGQQYNRVVNRMQILAYYINNIDNKVKPSGIRPI